MPVTEMEIVGDSCAITGGGQGIGNTIATHFAELGVDVVINDVEEDRLEVAADDLAEAPGEVVTIAGDISDPDTADTMVAAAVDSFGGLDIVINNVGLSGPSTPTEDLAHETFMRMMEVNLGGLFNMSSSAIPQLRESDDGRIVSIASIRGKQPAPHKIGYATSKIGVIGFTRTLATDLGPDQINVNAICPGPVEGPRWRGVIEEQAASRGMSESAVEEEFRSDSPMGAFMEAADVADMVLVLCSTRTQRVTGQDINVSAGSIMY